MTFEGRDRSKGVRSSPSHSTEFPAVFCQKSVPACAAATVSPVTFYTRFSRLRDIQAATAAGIKYLCGRLVYGVGYSSG